MKTHRAFALHCDVPPERARAWNVAAVAFAAGDLYVADRFAVLGVVLAALAGMVAAAGIALAWIAHRNDRQRIYQGQAQAPEVAAEHAKVAAFAAARRAQPAETTGVAA